MIRGTRRPGGAGRRMSGRVKGGRSKGSGGSKSGCALFLVFASSASGAAGLALVMVTK